MSDSTIAAARPTPGPARAILAAAGLWVAFVLASRADFIPIWDGRVYAECIIDAASRFSLGSLRCAGHASQVYVAFAATLQAIAPDSFVPMLVGNALLLVAAIVGFHRLSVRAFAAPEQAIDRALLTAAFALQPAMLAATLQPGLDLPLVPALLWCIAFALSGNFIALAIAGVALCFTKETGVLLYGALIACCALLALVLRSRDAATSRSQRVRSVAIASMPLAVFAVYLLTRASVSTGNAVWNTSSTGESLVRQFLVPRIDLHLIKYLALIFVLNFAWVPTLILLADGFVGATRAGHRLPARGVAGSEPRVLMLLALLTASTLYALTRFTTFGHTRYFLALIPLLLFAMYASLLRLRIPVMVRRGILGAYAAALMVSDVRTVDPVSRAAYGTFAIGDHRLLRMTSITNECCGAGQDQLAYSAEFTVMHELIDGAVETTQGTDSIAIVVPDSLDWMIVGRLDARTHRRTLARRGAIEPRVIEHWKIFAGRATPPRRATFIALPTGNNERALAKLATIYVVGDRRRFVARGYVIDSYPLVLRDVRP